MKKLSFIFLLLLPFTFFGQSRREKSEIPSFIGYTVKDCSAFFNYMINELGYVPGNDGKHIDIQPTSFGGRVILYKDGAGYEYRQALTINIYCDKYGENIKKIIMTGSISVLLDVYLDFYEGTVEENMPKKGGLDKTYTTGDEIRIYPDKLTVLSNNKSFNNN